MGKTAHAMLMASVVLTSGCTSLSSSRIEAPAGSNDAKVEHGLIYRLPAKQFSVKAGFEIKDCVRTGDTVLLDADVTASYTESLVGDDAYAINYSDLNGLTKVTNTEFTVSEAGLLVGVNASITDQSGSIMQNTAGAIASVARASVLPMNIATFNTSNLVGQAVDAGTLQAILKSVPFAERDSVSQSIQRNDSVLGQNISDLVRKIQQQNDPCKKINDAKSTLADARKELAKEGPKDKERSAEQAKLDVASALIKGFKEMVDTYKNLGDSEEKQALLGRIITEEKRAADARRALTALGESRTATLEKKISEAKTKLIVSASTEIVPKSKASTSVEISKADLNQLLQDRLQEDQLKLPKVIIEIEPLDSAAPSSFAAPNKKGIAYRVPTPALVKLYGEFPDTGNGPPRREKLDQKISQVPQFGPVGKLDLSNIIFDDNLIEVAFSGTTGSPSKLAFRAKSKADIAAASAKDVAGTYLQLQKDKRDDQLTALKTQMELDTAAIALANERSALALTNVQNRTTAETTRLQADLTRVQNEATLASTRLDILRDQQRLDAVRTGTATAAEVELEALGTQEKLLDQQLKILKLQQSIAAEQAKIKGTATQP